MEQFIVGLFIGSILTVVILSLIMIAGDRKDKKGD